MIYCKSEKGSKHKILANLTRVFKVLVRSQCNELSDQSLMMDSLNYFSFQPVFYDLCNKGCGMCCPVCGMVHIKDPLLLIEKCSPCSGNNRFPFLLSE